MKQTCPTSKRRQRGGSLVEVALLAPWIFFLFVGIFDFGFYAYAAICTQNAARIMMGNLHSAGWPRRSRRRHE